MFQVNQKVWDVLYGEGTVSHISGTFPDYPVYPGYPVHVKFADGSERLYSTDGKSVKTNKNPSIYPYPVEVVKKVMKPSINWEHVNPKYKYLSQDSDGDAWLYTDKPSLAISVWAARGEMVDPRMFASYVEGTCDWKESLIQRPEDDNHDD